MKTRFKSIHGAERRIRELKEQLRQWRVLAEEQNNQLRLLAKLAAEGPAFDNPIIVWEAKSIRNELLRRMGMGPDGKFLS